MKLKLNAALIITSIVGIALFLVGFKYMSKDGIMAHAAASAGQADPTGEDAQFENALKGGVMGQVGNVGLLDDDFVIAEYNGKKIRNKDLGGELSDLRKQALQQLIERQLQMTNLYIEKKLKGNPANAKFHLKELRMEVNIQEEDPSRGPVDAPVTIVEFSDYKCGYCAKVNPILNTIYQNYKGKVRHVFKDFPIFSPKLSMAGQCVHKLKPGKFWLFQQYLFENKKSVNENNVADVAVKMGVNKDAFNGCYLGGQTQEIVKANFLEGQKLGIRGTPAMFINGKFINGYRPLEALKEIIDQEIASPN